MRNEQEVNRAIEQYADTVRRLCMVHLKNHADTEDIFQTVFLKYLLYDKAFATAEHEKAWLIRVAVNACKDHLKSFFRRKTVPLEVLAEEADYINEEQRSILHSVLSLPDKYRDVIYLHYYEGYNAAEIGAILSKKENTVYSLLSRGRAILKETLGGDALDQ